MEPKSSRNCDQHPHPTVFDPTTYNCILEECSICPTLANLDAEILKAQDIVSKLSEKRSALISQVNDHHKPPINRIPFELISQIFIDIFKEYSDAEGSWANLVPLRLGRVCRMWRNVTLGTPQLWTMVNIKINSCGPLYDIDLAEEWFRRSRSLPLSMNIKFVDCNACDVCINDYSDFSSSIILMRSHSARWSRVDIKINTAYLLDELLDDLQNLPEHLEHLSVGWCDGDGDGDGESQEYTHPVLLPRSISQTGTRDGGVGLLNLPCGLDRLTHMDMRDVPVVEVVNFIENAPNLRECRMTLDENIVLQYLEYPGPSRSIIAQHLSSLRTSFSANAEFFCNLTLPSLQTLEHRYYTITSQSDLEELANCLDRSSPPIRDFNLSISISPFATDNWFEVLPPTVTSITVDISDLFSYTEHYDEDHCTITEEFLAALARRSGTLFLPNLESLHLSTRGMSGASWTSLCDIFHDYRTSPNAPEEAGEILAPRRSLKNIEIYQTEKWERDFAMENQVFEFFEGLKNVGVELKVGNDYGPKFGKTPVVNIVDEKFYPSRCSIWP